MNSNLVTSFLKFPFIPSCADYRRWTEQLFLIYPFLLDPSVDAANLRK
ncbi:hypothetical protein ACOWPH_10230 [Anabaena sp. PCC 7938]|nr:hypothetical protein [Anabaena sp. CCAP 1446/1C]MCM2407109.1 hypothetical protein [Anabaena sp. CCAP 1446/1C]